MLSKILYFSLIFAILECISDDLLRQNYSDLLVAIQDPAGLAGSLYSRGIICQSVRDEIQQRGDLTTKGKATLLINAQVTTNPSMFQVFLEVLKKEPSLSTIVERMSVLSECTGTYTLEDYHCTQYICGQYVRMTTLT